MFGKMLKTAPSILLLGSVTAALYFLYYFLTEATLAASPGKLLAGIRVARKNQGPASPSISAVLIRNAFRLVDYPFFFVTAVGLMEATEKHQRLGDVLAKTVVIREIVFEARRLPPETTPLAGATRRAIAWALDLLLVLPLGYGLLLLIPVSRTGIANIAVNAVLPLTLLTLALSETFFQTTPGKALLGLKVAQEDGRPARFASLWLRNVFKLADANPIGYLCVFLSSRKQRPGDAAAGTLVFRDRHGFRGWLAVPFLVVLTLAVVRGGLRNQDSLLQKGLDLRIGPVAWNPFPKAVKRLPLFKLGLLIDDLDVGFSEKEVNPDKTFLPGQAVYLLFRISGYAVQADKAWIQADLRVQDQHQNLILDLRNVVNSSLPVAGQKSTNLIARFSLNPKAQPGPYRASLRVRDMFSGRETEGTETFRVRP